MSSFVVGSLAPIAIDPDRMNRILREEPAAFESWRRYGLTTAESLLAHYVSDGEAIRAATRGVKTNTLENPYYEFYSPRQYAVPVKTRVLESHDYLVELRGRRGLADLSVYLSGPVSKRLHDGFRAEGHFLSGLRLQIQDRPYTEFEQDFETALTIAPWNDNLRAQIVAFLWNHAGILYLDGAYEPALSYMRRAVEVFPADGEIRYYHGMLLLQTGRREPGLAEIREAIELEPRLLAPRRRLASELLALRDHRGAVGQMEAILAIDPDDLYTLVTLGAFLAEHGTDPQQAEELIARAYRLSPRDASVTDARAWAAFHRGDLKTARSIVERGGAYYEGEPLFVHRRERILQAAP
jgi:tetratricopeptide (TPR) repeat protein